MRNLHLGLGAVAWVLTLWPFGSISAAEPSHRDADLFPRDPATGARTFDGWEFYSEDPKAELGDVWRVDGEVIVCKGAPKGYLATRAEFRDFVLTLQWRWPPEGKPGKGGVLLRTTGPDKLWPKSLEAQLNWPDAGDFWGLDGFELTGPPERSESLDHPKFGKLTHFSKTRAAEKPPGEWNRYEIVARGDTVTLKINGQMVNRATGCERAPGKIVLTAEGDEIHFRCIELTPIEK